MAKISKDVGKKKTFEDIKESFVTEVLKQGELYYKDAIEVKPVFLKESVVEVASYLNPTIITDDELAKRLMMERYCALGSATVLFLPELVRMFYESLQFEEDEERDRYVPKKTGTRRAVYNMK